MRIRWWQSIRWRLAIGFMLVALLATALLALVVTITIDYYYGVDQTTRLTTFASTNAQRIGQNYTQSGTACSGCIEYARSICEKLAGWRLPHRRVQSS